MNIQPQTQQPISDDQELAKVLAGINQESEALAAAQSSDATASTTPTDDAPTTPADDSAMPAADDTTLPEPTPVIEEPVVEPEPATPEQPSYDTSNYDTPNPIAQVDSNLTTIKQDALNELRPLVDKLNVSSDEKFDTYLLLLRSTDDTSLISPAYEAAKGITDEARRAQALLDIIKEIDFLSNPQQ